MLGRVLRASIPAFILLVLLCAASLRLALADNGTSLDWFADSTPLAKKIVDLPSGAYPQMSNLDCTPITLDYRTTVRGSGQDVNDCEVDSPIGPLTTSSRIITTGNQAYDVKGPVNHSYIMPIPNTSLVAVMIPGSIDGVYMGFYNSLTRADLSKETNNQVTYTGIDYKVTKSPDYLLKAGNQSLSINPEAMAFSKNGTWMVVDLPRSALLRINLETMEVTPFAESTEDSWELGIRSQQLAISNDGRYVAQASRYVDSPSLNVYDLSSCSGSLRTTTLPGGAICKHRDIWQGMYATTGRGDDMGISTEIAPTSMLGNLRFVDDGNISFTAYYGHSPTDSDFRAATYLVTAAGADEHNLGLLGMGDSYISGEGEFQYVSGTDTDINKCHLSKLAYPYLLGGLYTDSYQSVACSGAVTDDISNNDKGYNGQEGSLNSYDKEELLGEFKVGYLVQQEFAQTYKPETILLSIGGNDVGFSDIIKSCVAGLTDQANCYATYDDRLALLKSVDASFDKLVKTYTTVRDSSPSSRIYVVGYPQIVKPDGNCADNVHLNATETEFSAQLIAALDGVVEQAAAKAGVFYVDTQQAFDGYRLCEGKPGAIAVNGLTAGNDSGLVIPILNKQATFIGKESYHPTTLGHQLLESTIAKQTHHLTASMPTPQTSLTAPIPRASDPLLANFSPTTDNMPILVHDDRMTTSDYVTAGALVALDVAGLQFNILPQSLFHTVLHSDPIDLGTTTADENGNIQTNISIPAALPSGLHTIHLYGKDFAGNDIDIQKQIYVINPSSPANSSSCQIVPDSGHDVDKDGIDDACDPDIGPAPVEQPGASGESSPDVSTLNNGTDVGSSTTLSVMASPTPTLSLATTEKSAIPSAGEPSTTFAETGEVLGVDTTSTQKVVPSTNSEDTPTNSKILRSPVVYELLGAILLLAFSAWLVYRRKSA